MKTRLYIIALFSVIAILVNAQPSEQYNPVNNQAIQSQQIIKGGSNYQSVVYEPFSNASPADQGYKPAQAPGSQPRRAALDDGDFNETGENGIGDEGSPIGDGVWVMLLLALAFGGYVYLRKQHVP